MNKTKFSCYLKISGVTIILIIQLALIMFVINDCLKPNSDNLWYAVIAPIIIIIACIRVLFDLIRKNKVDPDVIAKRR